MKNLCIGAIWLLLGTFFTASSGAAAVLTGKAVAPDRPLLVSARYYTPLSRPWDRSYYHLYRFNPDGSGKTQLTFHHQDDTEACWSPDGRQIAFTRYDESSTPGREGTTQICVQAARPHATARLLLRLPVPYYYLYRITWSGDGYCLAVETPKKIIFVTPRGTVLRQMKAYNKSFLGFAPDGKHYAVSTVDRNHYLVETRSGRKTRLADAGVWWDSKTFLSWRAISGKEAERKTSLPMTFRDLKGNVIKQVNLRPTALQRKYFLAAQDSVVPIWDAARVGPKSSLLYIGFGKPQEQLFADMRTGTIRRWHGHDTGANPMQLSPDGNYAYSLRGFKDLARYGNNRDGEPRFVDVNTLQVTNLKQPNHFKDIIRGLVDMRSVDWRR